MASLRDLSDQSNWQIWRLVPQKRNLDRCSLFSKQQIQSSGQVSAAKICRAGVHIVAKPTQKDAEGQMQVSVRDNNVDQALRVLKKKLQREGVFREMKLKQHFEKPSVRKAREKAEGISRQRKLARKKAEREGLL